MGLLRLFGAMSAETIHHHVVQVDVKAIVPGEQPLQRGEKVLGAFDGLATLPADQVVVVAFVGMVVDEGVADAALEHAAGLFKKVEGPVHR